jgi:hyaluronoglucosaminidase
MVLANYVKGYEDGIVGAKNSPLLAKYANLKLDYATVNGSGRIVMEAKETAPELDPTELIAVLEVLKELNPEDYTEESVLAVEAALADVFELIEKEDLTQEELDAAVEALKAAIDALEPIQSETEPTEPETDPTEPETEPTEPETTVPETTKPGTGDNAQTGDFSIVIYSMLALSSLCSMGLVIGKKKD